MRRPRKDTRTRTAALCGGRSRKRPGRIRPESGGGPHSQAPGPAHPCPRQDPVTHLRRHRASGSQGSAPPWGGNAARPAGQAGEAGQQVWWAGEPHSGWELWWDPLEANGQEKSGRRPAGITHQAGGLGSPPSFIPKESGHPWQPSLAWWPCPAAEREGLLMTLQDRSGGEAGGGGSPPGTRPNSHTRCPAKPQHPRVSVLRGWSPGLCKRASKVRHGGWMDGRMDGRTDR